MVPIETGVRAGVYVDPEDAAETTLIPDDVATAVVDEQGSAVTALVDGEALPLFDVIVAGEPLRLARTQEHVGRSVRVAAGPSAHRVRGAEDRRGRRAAHRTSRELP